MEAKEWTQSTNEGSKGMDTVNEGWKQRNGHSQPMREAKECTQSMDGMDWYSLHWSSSVPSTQSTTLSHFQ